jgi:excisionase family DNA binding protein
MYLKVREAAKELGGVSESLVYGLCKAGRLEHIRVGVGRGTIRIPRAAVERLKEEGRGRVAADHPPLKHLTVD